MAAKLKEPNTTQRDFEATIKEVEQAAVLVLGYYVLLILMGGNSVRQGADYGQMPRTCRRGIADHVWSLALGWLR